MSPHRFAMPLGPRRQTIIHNHINIQAPPQRHQCNCSIFGGGFGMGMFGMGMGMPMMGMGMGMPMMGMDMMGGFPFMGGMNFTDMFSGMFDFGKKSEDPDKTKSKNESTPQEKCDKLKGFFPDYEFTEINGRIYAKDKNGDVIDTDDFDSMFKTLSEKAKNDAANKASSTPNNNVNNDKGGNVQRRDKDGNVEGDTGKEPKYEIGHEEETTYTINNYDTWWGIANAKYELPKGVSSLDLAYALAAANSGEEDPEKALALAKQGIYFKVGDSIKLPDELEVNGVKIKLKGNASEIDSIKTDPAHYMGSGQNAKNWSVSVDSNGYWYITKDGVRQNGRYATKDAAEQQIAKEKANSK